MTFQPYVAKARRFADQRFDFLIETPMAMDWYGGEDQALPEREWCTDRIKPGDTVIDCGAHHGMTSIVFANCVGPAGSVIAFEPVAANASVIRRNADLNGLRNIDVRVCGLSDKDESLSIPSGENAVLPAVVNRPFYRRLRKPWTAVTKIDLRRLDDEIPATTKVSMIKLDVEGAELLALRGATQTLRHQPAMAIEIHNFIHGGRDLPAIREILHGLGPYRYYLNGEIFNAIEGPFDTVDIERLAAYQNPHLYCEPSRDRR